MTIKGEITMKKLIPIMCLVLTVFTLAGCGPTFSVAKATATMEGFIEDANLNTLTGYGYLKDHTSSSADMYSTADAAFWQTELSSYVPLSGLTVSEDYATATGTGSVIFTFYFDDNYKIESIYRGTSNHIFY